MWIWLLFFVYTLISASGLFLMKTGTKDSSLLFSEGIISFQASVKLIIGLLLYICSFFLSVFLMSRMKLSVFYPAGTGIILVITCVMGYLLLKEQMGTKQLVGIVLILSGVIIMNTT